jgi:hypothetical protein
MVLCNGTMQHLLGVDILRLLDSPQMDSSTGRLWEETEWMWQGQCWELQSRIRKISRISWGIWSKRDCACHGEHHTGMHINMQCLATQLLSKLEFLAQFQAWPARAKKNYHKELHAVNRNSLCLLGDSIAIR